MAVLSFLMNRQSKPRVAYFNHGTAHSEQTQSFVEEFCKSNSLDLVVGNINRAKGARESSEEYWRNQRYAFFHGLDLPVVTAHNINDCMETWIFTALHGEPKLIPYRNKNVIRPFRQTSKRDFIAWCQSKNIPWEEDASNKDVTYARNRIRHRIMPEALIINPGLEKVIRKRIRSQGVEQVCAS